MRIGIITKAFIRAELGQVLDMIQRHGLFDVQFHPISAGLEPMPGSFGRSLAEEIRQGLDERGVRVAALQGAYNILDPDLSRRRENFRRLSSLAESCAILGTKVMTLCTGTRDPDDMWRRHPDNDAPAAWTEMVAEMREIVKLGEGCGVVMGVEPEVSNVMNTAVKARRLLDEVGSDHLKIVMDGANLFHHGDLARIDEVLDHAFELLGRDIALAHAKDLSRDGDAGQEAAGTGKLNYPRYLSLLHQSGYDGALILHSLGEDQVEGCVDFLKRSAAEAGVPLS